MGVLSLKFTLLVRVPTRTPPHLLAGRSDDVPAIASSIRDVAAPVTIEPSARVDFVSPEPATEAEALVPEEDDYLPEDEEFVQQAAHAEAVEPEVLKRKLNTPSTETMRIIMPLQSRWKTVTAN